TRVPFSGSAGGSGEGWEARKDFEDRVDDVKDSAVGLPRRASPFKPCVGLAEGKCDEPNFDWGPEIGAPEEPVRLRPAREEPQPVRLVPNRLGGSRRGGLG